MRRKFKDPGAAVTALGAGYVGIGEATPGNNSTSPISTNAVPRPKSRAAAINAKCRECIYDPRSPGNWRQQVEACSSTNCALHPFRPISRPKGRAEAADARLPPSHGLPCAGGLENDEFRVSIDHSPPPVAPPLESCGPRLLCLAPYFREKNKKAGQPEWREP